MSAQYRPRFLHWTILGLGMLTLMFSGTIVVKMLLLKQVDEFTVLQQSASEVTKNPVVTALPVGNLLTPQWFAQLQQYTGEAAVQLGGIADRLGKPLAPANVSALDTALGNRVLIQWSTPPGQQYDGVELERSDVNTMQAAVPVTTTLLPAAGYYFDTTVNNGTAYYYYLRSYRLTDQAERQYSDWSNVVSVIPSDTTPPKPPVVLSVQSLVASAAEPKVVAGLVITWQASTSSDVTGYRIYRSSISGTLGSLLDEVAMDVTAARDTSVTPGVTYYYTVTAIDAARNESATTVWVGSAGHSSPFITTTPANTNGD